MLEEKKLVLDELRNTGYEIDSIEDLYPRGVKLGLAIPILLKWLPKVEDKAVKDMIIRALSDRQAQGIAEPALIEEFKNIALDPYYRGQAWAIGNALEILFRDNLFHEALELATDRRYGGTRQMIVMALGKTKKNKEEAIDALLKLIQQEEVRGHAIFALGKLKAERARPEIEKYLDHESAYIRRVAKKAIAKIDKAIAKGREKNLNPDRSKLPSP